MLARLALRLAAIAALKGATQVGDNVLDSAMGALDVAADGTLRTDEDRPFVSVYVDGSRIGDGPVPEGLDQRALHRCGATEMTIETGISAAMSVVDEATGESVVLPGIPDTDAAFELYLDALDRQVVEALTDPVSPWAEIWRKLSSRILKIERRRVANAMTGQRLAAHQIVITLDLLPDPVRGEEVRETSVWATLLARMESDGHPWLEAVRTMIGAPGEGHLALRRRFVVTLDEARALSVATVLPVDEVAPAIVWVEGATG